MKNKIKKILILILIIIFSIVVYNYSGLSLSQSKIYLFPSEEMKKLEQIEDGFNLPESLRRYVVDDGYNTDWKGARHYTRYIHLTYNNIDSINFVKEKVENAGWMLNGTSEYSGEKTYKYTKSTAQTNDYQTEITISINSYLSKNEHSLWIQSRVKGK